MTLERFAKYQARASKRQRSRAAFSLAESPITTISDYIRRVRALADRSNSYTHNQLETCPDAVNYIRLMTFIRLAISRTLIHSDKFTFKYIYQLDL